MKPSERAVAIPLIAGLKADSWEVFEEVRYRYDDTKTAHWIADVIAKKAGVLAVFEVKAAFSLAVMRQAERWINLAHEIYVVVPGTGTPANPDHAYGHGKLGESGIGVLHIRKHSKVELQMAARAGGALPPPEALVVPAQGAVPSRCSTARLEAALHPAQASGEYAGAGTKTGERVTPANLTHKAIREHLETLPFRTGPLADVARAVGAKDWLVTQWAKAAKIKCVQLDGRELEIALRLVDPGAEAPILDARQMKSKPQRWIPT